MKGLKGPSTSSESCFQSIILCQRDDRDSRFEILDDEGMDIDKKQEERNKVRLQSKHSMGSLFVHCLLSFYHLKSNRAATWPRTQRKVKEMFVSSVGVVCFQPMQSGDHSFSSSMAGQ